MQKSNDWIVGLMLGAFFLFCAVSSGDWFMIGWMVRLFGRRSTRVAYLVLAAALLIVSLQIRG